jgi:hypothetical protein
MIIARSGSAIIKGGNLKVKIKNFILVICSMLTACSSSNLDVELGDSCAPVGSEVFYQGIYKSDRGVCGDYYCWTYIRFFQDCTYESVAAFEENTNTVAKELFLSSENIEKNKTGTQSKVPH